VLYFEEGYSESLGLRIKMPEKLSDRVLNISDVNIWQDMSSKYILYYNYFFKLFLKPQQQWLLAYEIIH